jgi:PAS domain-containing protein
MTTLQMLTVRTNAALGRLVSLQKRAERITAPANGVVRPALKELTDALDELQVANEQLEAQVVELSAAKAVAGVTARRFDELLDVMPFSCVWTDGTGEIVEANVAAAALFNVSRQHLAGRPLILFLVDRSDMMDAFGALAAGIVQAVDFSAVVRPRERRVRSVQVSGRRLESDNRLCWFLLEQQSAEPPAPDEA